MDPVFPVNEDIRRITAVYSRSPVLRKFGCRAKRLLNADFPTTKRFAVKTSSGDLVRVSYVLERENAPETSSSSTTSTSTSRSTSTSTPTSTHRTPTGPFSITVIPELRFKSQGVSFKGAFNLHDFSKTKLRLTVRDFWSRGLRVVCRSENVNGKQVVGTELTLRHAGGNGTVGLHFEDNQPKLVLSAVVALNDRRKSTTVGSAVGNVVGTIEALPDISIGAEVKCTVPDAAHPQGTIDDVTLGANYVSRLFDISGTVGGRWGSNTLLNPRESIQVLYRHSMKTAFAADITMHDPEMKGLSLREKTTTQFGVKHRLNDATVIKGRLNTQTGVVGVSLAHKFSKKSEVTLGSEFFVLGGVRSPPLNVFGFSFNFSP